MLTARSTRPCPRAAALALACLLLAALAACGGADARAAGPRTSAVPDVIWVAPWGDDRNPATRCRPVRTLTHALAAATGGQRIHLLPGVHPRFRDFAARRSEVVVTGAPGRRRPIVMGGELLGATRVRLRGITFGDMVLVSNHPVRHWGQVADRITIERSFFTSPTPYAGTCVMIRNGSRRIAVRDSRLHACRYGITGPHDGAPDPSQRLRSGPIAIERNWIGPVRTDALQFTHWQDVLIRGNVIDYQHDPSGVDHTDAIQITGDTHRVRIADNVIQRGGQLVFVQEPFGFNSDLVIQNNLVRQSENYAIKISSTAGVRVIGNTVWSTRWGGLLLRSGVTGAVVANNALEGYGTTDSPEVVHRDHNFVAGMRERPGPNDIVGGDPGFADPGRGDFRLRPDSRLLGAADLGFALRTVPSGYERDALGCTLPPRRQLAGRRRAGLPACGAAR